MINTKVSIIIPVYNSEYYLKRCINSVLAQTFTFFECILVNDCSTDKSGQICDEYSREDIRIKVIHNSINKGSSLSRRIGFEYSTSDYILFIDSDDWIEPDMIYLLYHKAINDSCDITICNLYYKNKDDTIKLLKQDNSSNNNIDVIRKIFNYKINVYLFNKLIKRELLLFIEFPFYNCSEDSVITTQLLYYAKNIGFIDEYLYYYCYNDNSLTQNKDKINEMLIEENKNWHFLIKFLKDKYCNLNIFEPELSVKINQMKDKYIININLKNKKELFYLYSESKYYLWRLKYLIKSFIKLIIPNFIINKFKKYFL